MVEKRVREYNRKKEKVKGRGKPKFDERGEGIVILLWLIMMKTIYTWNVRGLGREEKRWGIRALIRKGKVDIFTLWETKL